MIFCVLKIGFLISNLFNCLIRVLTPCPTLPLPAHLRALCIRLFLSSIWLTNSSTSCAFPTYFVEYGISLIVTVAGMARPKSTPIILSGLVVTLGGSNLYVSNKKKRFFLRSEEHTSELQSRFDLVFI